MKIKCPACDFENEEGTKFCSNCNEPLFNVKDSETKREGSYIKKENKEHHGDNLILDTVNKKTKTLYCIMGLILFLCIFAYFLGPKLGLFLTPSYTTLRTTRAPGVRIDINTPTYPLKFVSDGYKFTKIIEGTKDVEWVWQYTALNNTNKRLYVLVVFKLIDVDSFVISSSSNHEWVNPYSEVTIRGGSSFSIYDLKRLYCRTWNIDYSYLGEIFILPGIPGGLGPKTF